VSSQLIVPAFATLTSNVTAPLLWRTEASRSKVKLLFGACGCGAVSVELGAMGSVGVGAKIGIGTSGAALTMNDCCAWGAAS
jgi:hypothetical protein